MDEKPMEGGVFPWDVSQPYQGATALERVRSQGLPDRVRQFGAWVVIVLLMALPVWVAFAHGTSSIAWITWWAVVSVCAGLYAARLATQAFPGQSKPSFAVAIAVLALVNLLFSLSALLFPSFKS